MMQRFLLLKYTDAASPIHHLALLSLAVSQVICETLQP